MHVASKQGREWKISLSPAQQHTKQSWINGSNMQEVKDGLISLKMYLFRKAESYYLATSYNGIIIIKTFLLEKTIVNNVCTYT